MGCGRAVAPADPIPVSQPPEFRDTMPTPSESISPTGVRLAADFRDNLIIDRFDPMFRNMRASKRSTMKSENSEDAVTWNVFRTLRQIDPSAWLPALFSAAFNEAPESSAGAAVYVWRSIPPPPALVVDLDEGASEIDVVIEAPQWVWFIEAKYRSDISTKTTNRPQRDQVLRNIDVGSYYAGVRRFYFSLLVASPSRSPLGTDAVARYRDLDEPRRALRDHRPDGLINLRAVSQITWQDLGNVLGTAAAAAPTEAERGYATRARTWLEAKGLADSAG
jgi:hypothetical protein